MADLVDRYIARVLAFVGTDEEVSEDEKVEPPEPEVVDIALSAEEVEPPFDALLAEAVEGEPWNALAKLRRHLEVQLREVAFRLGLKQRHLRSAGQIVHLLEGKLSVDPDALERLRYAISVSNRAIHGRDVSSAEAQEAIWNGAVGLGQVIDRMPTQDIIIIDRDD